jgi:pyruvate/2-oxoglutarate dehydrogenase complex dihydrolipoamide acyltransferase (E2) component
MQDIRANEALWASTMFPQGIVERWLIADQAIVARGQRIAEIRIEGALHDIAAPASGHVTIVAAVSSLVEPGALLATLRA